MMTTLLTWIALFLLANYGDIPVRAFIVFVSLELSASHEARQAGQWTILRITWLCLLLMIQWRHDAWTFKAEQA